RATGEAARHRALLQLYERAAGLGAGHRGPLCAPQEAPAPLSGRNDAALGRLVPSVGAGATVATIRRANPSGRNTPAPPDIAPGSAVIRGHCQDQKQNERTSHSLRKRPT